MARRQGNSTWIQYGYNNWKVGYCETQKCRISSFCPCSICFLFQLFTILAYSADVNFVEKAISVCLSVCVCECTESFWPRHFSYFFTLYLSLSLCPCLPSSALPLTVSAAKLLCCFYSLLLLCSYFRAKPSFIFPISLSFSCPCICDLAFYP